MASIGDKLLRAAKAKFFADREAAEAKLTVYLNSSVGVGEHPDIVGEVVKLIGDVSKANSGIEAIDKIAAGSVPPTKSPPED